MQIFGRWILIFGLFSSLSVLAQEQTSDQSHPPKGDSWSKVLKDRTKRGTLHDAIQKVRGDTGKWNDDPRLQHAPPITRKPPKMPLDDWADQLQESNKRVPSNDDNWLLFKTRQLDDNDRVWIERIERDGDQFTIVLSEAIWQGRYLKTFTYYNVFGVNLGKLPPGTYTAKWVVKPLEFRAFEGSGKPSDQQKESWPKDEREVNKKPSEFTVKFTVTDSAQ